MAQRIREAMNQTDPAPIGSEGNVVEDDETHVSGKEVNKRRNKRLAKNDAFGGNQAVPTPVERDGRARYFHMPRVTTKTLLPIGVQAAQRPSNLTTDGACVHPKVDKEFASHSSVDHVAGTDRAVTPEMLRNARRSSLCAAIAAAPKLRCCGAVHVPPPGGPFGPDEARDCAS